MPPQQSAGLLQMSPVWPQYEGCEQTPFEQKVEQHSEPAVHGLPSVLHVVFSAAHVPLVQVWLQH